MSGYFDGVSELLIKILGTLPAKISASITLPVFQTFASYNVIRVQHTLIGHTDLADAARYFFPHFGSTVVSPD